jgi:hypothetical protein
MVDEKLVSELDEYDAEPESDEEARPETDTAAERDTQADEDTDGEDDDDKHIVTVGDTLADLEDDSERAADREADTDDEKVTDGEAVPLLLVTILCEALGVPDEDARGLAESDDEPDFDANIVVVADSEIDNDGVDEVLKNDDTVGVVEMEIDTADERLALPVDKGLLEEDVEIDIEGDEVVERDTVPRGDSVMLGETLDVIENEVERDASAVTDTDVLTVAETVADIEGLPEMEIFEDFDTGALTVVVDDIVCRVVTEGERLTVEDGVAEAGADNEADNDDVPDTDIAALEDLVTRGDRETVVDAEEHIELLIVLDTHALTLIEKDAVIVTEPVGLPECDVVSLENFEGVDEGVAHAVDEMSDDKDLQAVALIDEVTEAVEVRFAEGVEVVDAVTAMLGDGVADTEGDLDSRGDFDDETVIDCVEETEVLDENEDEAL